MIEIGLPGGHKIKTEKGSTILQIAQKIGERLASASISARVNGKKVDLTKKIYENSELILDTFETKEGKETYWHSTSHLLAMAVLELYPSAQITIGPSIEEGFYYDIDYEKNFTPEDLEKIEKKMNELIKRKIEVKRHEWDKPKATHYFEQKKQKYKIELIKEIEDEKVSLYEQGNFIDLCTGPHITNTGKIGFVKLLRVSGAYWKGDSKNKQLQRIYGISFPEKKQLEEYLHVLEEREKRDHRKIGKEMEIFTFSEDIGQGLPLWLPKGEQLFHTLQEFMREEEEKAGYTYVRTPHIIKGKMFEKTGHIPYYKDSMYAPIEIEGENYYLKPMNCPHHHAIYSELIRSYKQLPLRLAEAGNVYRFELSGVMYGIIRARGFTQNDGHIYCTPEQLEDEIVKVVEMNERIYKLMGMKNYWFRLSLPDFEGHPEKYAGDRERWEIGADALRNAMKRLKREYIETSDEAAFYGPKIDIQSKNIRGKEESIATVQVDIMIPKRLGLFYIDEHDKSQIPIVIHRAIFGSYERVIAFLLEQTMGKFPLWLSPTQTIILPLSEKFTGYAEKIQKELMEKGIRSTLDQTNETLNYRIRNAQMKHTPYMIIIGGKEEETSTISTRTREGKQENGIKIEEFIQRLKKRNTGEKINQPKKGILLTPY